MRTQYKGRVFELRRLCKDTQISMKKDSFDTLERAQIALGLSTEYNENPGTTMFFIKEITTINYFLDD